LTKVLVGKKIASEAMRLLDEPEGVAYLKTIMADKDFQERAKQISMANLEEANRNPKLVSQMVLELRSPENQAKLQEVFGMTQAVDSNEMQKVFSKFAIAPKVPTKAAVSATSAVRAPSAGVQRGSDIVMSPPFEFDKDGNPVTQPLELDPIWMAIALLPWLALLVTNPFGR